MKIKDVIHKFSKYSEVLTPDLIDKLCDQSKKLIKIARLAKPEKCGRISENDFKFLKREIRYLQSNDKTIRYKMMMEMATINTLILVRSIWKKYNCNDPNEFLSESEAINLLKICAQKSPENAAENIQNYEISDERAFIDLAKLYIEKNASLAHYFLSFGRIKDQKAIVEIAKLGAKGNRYHLARHIDSFNIEDENERIEIAKLCIKDIAEVIPLFGITNKAALIEIAFLCAEKPDYSFPEHIGLFGIDNEETRIALAKICARTNPQSFCEFIRNFEIQDENERIELAKQCTESDPASICCQIKDFEIRNEETRIAIAKMCAPAAANDVIENIQNFEISDQTALVEIALLCKSSSIYSADKLIGKIQLLGITDQSGLIKIAKECANTNGSLTAYQFPKFNIESPEAHIEIAMLCMQNSKGDALDYLHNFNINDEETLIKLGKIAAQHKEGLLPIRVQKLNIQSEATRIEIAKISAEHSPRNTACNLINFNIDDREALAEIAKICANGAGDLTAKFFHYFKVSDPQTRIEIARLCATNGGDEIAEHIHNFKIEDPAILIELAKLCAKSNPVETARWIQYFKIKDQQVLIEIARFCLAGNLKRTLPHIQNFRINKKDLFKIARECALMDGAGTISGIVHFELNEALTVEIIKLALFHQNTDSGHLLYLDLSSTKLASRVSEEKIDELELYCFQCYPSCAKKFQFRTNCSEKLKGLYSLEKTISIEALETIETFITHVESFSNISFTSLRDLLEKLRDPKQQLSSGEKSDLFYILLKKTKLLAAMYVYLLSVIPEAEKRNKVIQSGLLTMVLNYWQPHMRWDIFQILLPNTIRSIDLGLPIEFKEGARARFYVTEMAQELIAQGVSKNLVDNFLKFAFRSKSDFKDGRVGGILVQLFVRMIRDPLITVEMNNRILQRLIDEAKLSRKGHFETKYPSVITLEDKLKGLDKTTPEYAKVKAKIKELRKAYKRKNNNEQHLKPGVSSLLILAGLKSVAPIEEEGSLEELVQRAFCKKVPMGPVDNFSNKFFQMFGSNRKPDAIFQYAASMARTGIPETLLCLGSYITAVLNGTFKEARYSTSASPLMATIAKDFPHILEEWKKGDYATFDELKVQKEITENKQFDYAAWLHRKIGDGHIPIKALKLKILKNYFTRSADLHTLLTSSSKNVSEAVEGSDDCIKSRFEFLCLNLTLDKSGEEKKEILVELRTLLNSTPFHQPEFLNDVKGILKDLTSGFDHSQLVVNSDDPIDLLLSGTEIRGSCQIVNGFPFSNIGLLGYLMHGGTRILKVSKSVDGPIEARCLIRLMWDGERPVLFRERFYPDTISEPEKKALDAMAKRCADKLDIPLLCLDGQRKYGKPIQSLGGIAPYEYFDGARSIPKNGICTISNAEYVRLI